MSRVSSAEEGVLRRHFPWAGTGGVGGVGDFPQANRASTNYGSVLSPASPGRTLASSERRRTTTATRATSTTPTAGREHLYQHHHLYSTEDAAISKPGVPRGILGVTEVTRRAGQTFSRGTLSKHVAVPASSHVIKTGGGVPPPRPTQLAFPVAPTPAVAAAAAAAAAGGGGGGGHRKKKWRPHCQHPSCLRPASYAETSTSEPVFCQKHKTSGQQDVVHPNRGDCEFVGCGRVSAYASAVDTRARFCHLHKEEGMVKVRDRVGTRCEELKCIKQASFAMEGDRYPKFCKTHRLVNMINIRNHRCSAPGCLKGASFATRGGQRSQFCSQHKADGMINTRRRYRCIIPGCTSREPMYAIAGQELPTLCAAHKEGGVTPMRTDIIARTTSEVSSIDLANSRRRINNSEERRVDQPLGTPARGEMQPQQQHQQPQREQQRSQWKRPAIAHLLHADNPAVKVSLHNSVLLPADERRNHVLGSSAEGPSGPLRPRTIDSRPGGEGMAPARSIAPREATREGGEDGRGGRVVQETSRRDEENGGDVDAAEGGVSENNEEQERKQEQRGPERVPEDGSVGTASTSDATTTEEEEDEDWEDKQDGSASIECDAASPPSAKTARAHEKPVSSPLAEKHSESSSRGDRPAGYSPTPFYYDLLEALTGKRKRLT